MLAHVLLSLASLAGAPAPPRPQITGLPQGARILEQRSLSAQGYPDRALVLWMLRPTRHPTGYGPDEPYTCPDETRGSYLSGPSRLSLVEASTGRIVNTVEVGDPHYENEDRLDLPYQIRRGRYYHTTSATERREAKPTILWLGDYNGDGRALELALFDAEACMGLQTTLIGYVPEEDRVVQYAVRLTIRHNGETSSETRYWVDYLFSEAPKGPGRWQYEIDYRGRGGALDRFTVRYNKATRSFEGTLLRSDAP